MTPVAGPESLGTESLGTGAVLRLGLVQAALGGLAVLATVTLNRVMVVEAHLPAVLPAALVALHYAVQLFRPVLGHRSDRGRRRTPFIRGGVVLAATATFAAAAAAGLLVRGHDVLGLSVAVLAYASLGLGIGTAGTALLALLGAAVPAARRPGAAATVWISMIAGIALTAGLCGAALSPFSPPRLLLVCAVAATIAAVIGVLAPLGLERAAPLPATAQAATTSLRRALRDAWSDPAARRFTGFVLVSMLAYSAEEILLEPFAGRVFGWAPGATASLTASQHGGALLGMLGVAGLGAWFRRRTGRALSLQPLTLGGCLLSGAALLLLAAGGLVHAAAALRPAAFALGFGNGVFAVAAIGAMMQLAGESGRGGVRIGLWGAAQAIAFAVGGLGAATAADLARLVLPDPALSYGAVLVSEAVLFGFAALQARIVFADAARSVTVIRDAAPC